MKARDFQPENFARFHPGGSLGRRLLQRVENEMVSDNLPFVDSASGILVLIASITAGGLGICIIDPEGRGLVTDGDIRRAIEKHGDLVFSLSAEDIMSKKPAVVEIGTRMQDALSVMEVRKITSLLIKDGDRIVGVVKK